MFLKKIISFLTAFSFLASCAITTGFSFSYLQEFNLPAVTSESTMGRFPFNDAKGNWAEASIAEMYAKGVIDGYEDSTFKPNKPVTMLEAVVVLGKLLKYRPSEFDINANKYLQVNFSIPEWAVGYVAVALKQELLLYSELQQVSQQQPLTREEAAVLAVRSLGLTKQTKKKKDITLPFTDAAQIKESMIPHVALACEYKIMNGFPDGRFQPGAPISRAETAVMLSNIALHLSSDSMTGFLEKAAPENDMVLISDSTGNLTQADVSGNCLIYRNGRPSTFDDLSENDFVRITKSKSGDLTVLLSQSNVPDPGTRVSFEAINAASSSPELQEWVETNKAAENYMAKESGNNLYFMVARGEKKTGGYTVEITKVSASIDEKGITYRVWTSRTNPAKDAMVIEVITYPYAVVKTVLPERSISSVIFVDEFNQILAETIM